MGFCSFHCCFLCSGVVSMAWCTCDERSCGPGPEHQLQTLPSGVNGCWSAPFERSGGWVRVSHNSVTRPSLNVPLSVRLLLLLLMLLLLLFVVSCAHACAVSNSEGAHRNCHPCFCVVVLTRCRPGAGPLHCPGLGGPVSGQHLHLQPACAQHHGLDGHDG